MTNQNDTQDEAERLAKIWADEHYSHSRTYQTEGTNGWHGFIAGYRAGQASRLLNEIKKLDGVAAVNLSEPCPGDLKRVVDQNRDLREENSRLKAGGETWLIERVERELAASRAEVERLKLEYTNLKKSHESYQNGEGNLFLDKVELLKQLASEKQKAQKLVEALEDIVRLEFDGETSGSEVSARAIKAIRDYSTDSGDGGEK